MSNFLFLKLFLFTVILISCNDNDGPEPPRDVQVQTLEDDEELVSFLQTHFYNYDDFTNYPDKR